MTTPLKKPKIGRPPRVPVAVRDSRKEDAILLAWNTDICKRAAAVDPSGELHWRSLWIGFAVAKGLDPHRAARIYDRKALPFELAAHLKVEV